ncbi:MAG: hypothetical protein RJA70_4746 [Pseudomonadota bacterium]|jgi:hypothetical protein
MRSISILCLASVSVLSWSCADNGADSRNDAGDGGQDAAAGELDAGTLPADDVKVSCGLVIGALCDQFANCGFGLDSKTCLAGKGCVALFAPACERGLKQVDVDDAKGCAEAISRGSCESVCEAGSTEEPPKACKPFLAWLPAGDRAGGSEADELLRSPADAGAPPGAVSVDAGPSDPGLALTPLGTAPDCYSQCMPNKPTKE